jgi:hypothetical protein
MGVEWASLAGVFCLWSVFWTVPSLQKDLLSSVSLKQYSSHVIVCHRCCQLFVHLLLDPEGAHRHHTSSFIVFALDAP